jgi:zinc transport system permease protein
MDDFLIRAMIGAGLLGAAAGPIGCIVLWRRMAYLGESVAHLGLTGVAAGILLGVSPLIGVVVLAILAALVMARAGESARGLIPSGTIIGIVGHVGLALGFVLLATMDTVRADLLGYLFGDVLALSTSEIIWIAAASAGLLVAIAVLWRPLIALSINRDIAIAEGTRHRLADTAFLVLVAILVALGLKIVGALLIVALILIPPAAARAFSRTPEAMAVLSAFLGAASAPLGIELAWMSNAPAGPSIVLAAAALLSVSLVMQPIAATFLRQPR